VAVNDVAVSGLRRAGGGHFATLYTHIDTILQRV